MRKKTLHSIVSVGLGLCALALVAIGHVGLSLGYPHSRYARPARIAKPDPRQETSAVTGAQVPGGVRASDSLAEIPAANKQRVLKSYGGIPLNFEANQGQTDNRVKFLSRKSGYTLFLTSTEAVLSFRQPTTRGTDRTPPIQPRLGKASSPARPGARVVRLPKPKSNIQKCVSRVLRIELVGAKPAPRVTGVEELPGKSNYFIGNDPHRWRTGISNYARVRYEQVYPGVDLVYYGNERQLEYDLILAPGSDPNAITIGFHGADQLEIGTKGDLVLRVGGEKLRWHKPRVYQEVNATKRVVPARYIVKDDRHISFQVAAYDVSKALVIDPMLSYSTYLGGSGNEGGNSIAVDSSGDAYVTGSTSSADFPMTPGAFQTASGGGNDAFVTKLNAAGNALVYSTFLGGSADDIGRGIAVDSSSGNAFLVGSTASMNFPTTPGSFQTSFGGGNTDAFVAKINSDGSKLLYSTYFGGSSDDIGRAIAVDSSGNVFVTGNTTSANFPTGSPPTTVGAFQTTFGGAGSNNIGDAFLTKLNPAGGGPTDLVYSTFLGGTSDDIGLGIALDSSGNAFVAGSTNSAKFPTTAGAFQTTFGGAGLNNIGDAFLTKLNPAGGGATDLLYSTYLGGSNDDEAEGIAVTTGKAFIAGVTASANFPTASPFQTSFGGGNTDIFVAKVNPAGLGATDLVYSTYLGGIGDDRANGIAVDSAGNAYLTGTTTSDNFPTAGPFQSALGGGKGLDAFFTKLKANGNALIHSSYLGGKGSDGGSIIVVDSSGNAYLTGTTFSTDFPTVGPFQPALAGTSDAFITKITPSATVTLSSATVTLSPITLTFGDQNVASTSAPQPLTLSNTGDAPLNITSIVPSGDFSESNNCPVPLAIGANCTINVTFTPATAGTRAGTLTITDDAPDSPQTVKLSGTGTAFSISAAPTSATVTAGRSATYTLTLTPNGFKGPVSLTCTGAPRAATCTISPMSVTLDGSSNATATVTVTTTAASMVAPKSAPPVVFPRDGFPVWVPYLLSFVLLALAIAASLAKAGRRALVGIGAPIGALVFLLLLCAACIGGGGGGNPGTPPGNSTLTVTATAGGLSRNIKLTLAVTK